MYAVQICLVLLYYHKAFATIGAIDLSLVIHKTLVFHLLDMVI